MPESTNFLRTRFAIAEAWDEENTIGGNVSCSAAWTFILTSASSCIDMDGIGSRVAVANYLLP
jgi:hypothetical protein